jgi:hypothetical protein
MKRIKPNLHMSIQPEKGDILPPLQKRIILSLAKNDPQTINQLVKTMKGSYKSYWTALESLKEKKLVQAVNSKIYRGREYPQFWLSSTGVLLSLFEGEKPEKLLEKTLKIYPEDIYLQAILEVSPILGTDAFEIAFQIVLSKGKIESSDLPMIILTQMQKDIDISQFKPLLTILKKHPDQFEAAKSYTQGLIKKLTKLDSMLMNDSDV